MRDPRDRDRYQERALAARVKYPRILRREVRGRRRWYVQLVLEGIPPERRMRGEGAVGLDIGPSTVAIAGEGEAALERFCPTVTQPWRELRRIERAMDRSKRATNSDCFNAAHGSGRLFLSQARYRLGHAPKLNYTTARINASLARLGSGFALWVDSVRLPAAGYPEPEASHFPDRVTAAIDAERRAQFLSEGAHFETEYAFLVSYLPPLRRNAKLAELIYDDVPGAEPQSPGDRQIAVFKRALGELEDGLSDILKLRRMKSYRFIDALGHSYLQDELVNYLSFAVTGYLTPLNVPACAMYIDAWLGG